MGQPPEFVVPVKRWPAYVLAALLPVILILNGLVVFLLFRMSPPTLAAPSGVLLIGLVLGGMLGGVFGLAVSTRLAFHVITHPPRLSASGIRLWLVPTRDYVLVPWPRVVAIQAGIAGFSRGLFVIVHDPQALASGASRRAQAYLRRLIRRHGTPFVYPIPRSLIRRQEIDAQIRACTGGRLVLTPRQYGLPRPTQPARRRSTMT